MLLHDDGKRFLYFGIILMSIISLLLFLSSGRVPEDKPKTVTVTHYFSKVEETGSTKAEGKLKSAFYPFSSHFLQVVKESEENRADFIAKRDAVIKGKNLSAINPWADPTMWNYFPPSYPCPFDKVRLGRIGDGGKWICGLREIINKPSPCVVYSFGVSGDSSFEKEVLDKTSCSVFGFDPTVSKMNLDSSKYAEGRVNFFKVGLKSSTDLPGQGKEWRLQTLKEIMSEQGHDWIDILKMDVEGAEFAGMAQVIQDFPEYLPFGMFNVELHMGIRLPNGKLEYRPFTEIWDLWNNLEAAGLRAFMNEVNHLWSVTRKEKPLMIEYSFINVQHPIQILLEEDWDNDK